MKVLCTQGTTYVDSQRYRLAVLEFTKAWDFYNQSGADRSSLWEKGALALSSRAQAYNSLAEEVEKVKNYTLALQDVEAYLLDFPYGAERKEGSVYLRRCCKRRIGTSTKRTRTQLVQGKSDNS
jgi:hypothetical protein